MTKADIINTVASNTGIEKADVHLIVDGFCDTIKNTMAMGKNIQIRGFGSFIVKKRARKVARNISKNTSIIIEAHYVPQFKPSKLFVNLIKNTPYLK